MRMLCRAKTVSREIEKEIHGKRQRETERWIEREKFNDYIHSKSALLFSIVTEKEVGEKR